MIAYSVVSQHQLFMPFTANLLDFEMIEARLDTLQPFFVFSPWDQLLP